MSCLSSLLDFYWRFFGLNSHPSYCSAAKMHKRRRTRLYKGYIQKKQHCRLLPKWVNVSGLVLPCCRDLRVMSQHTCIAPSILSDDVWRSDTRKDERGPQGRGESGQCQHARFQGALVGQDSADWSAKDWWLVSTMRLVFREVRKTGRGSQQKLQIMDG